MDGSVQKGGKDFLVSGAGIRRMYITDKMLRDFGRTDGCPRCENYGATHSEECRRRFEEKMQATGQAFDTTPVAKSNVETHITVAHSSASSPGLSSSASDSGSSSGSSPSVEPKVETPITSTAKPETIGEVNLVSTVALLDEPVSELWRDARAMRDKRFPYEAREQGRQKELHNLHLFDAVEDATPAKGEHTPDMVWVEEYRGDEVRARLCVRQFKQEARDDVFSGTPDSWIARFQIRRCAADRDRAIAIIDISVAFMHADIEEHLIVKVPQGVKSTTGFWKLKRL